MTKLGIVLLLLGIIGVLVMSAFIAADEEDDWFCVDPFREPEGYGSKQEQEGRNDGSGT